MVLRGVADKRFGKIKVDGREYPDFPGMAIWYCQEVVAGTVPACKRETQAAERFLAMVAEGSRTKGAMTWSTDHVVDVCDFVEKLPHVKGFTGDIVLEPVQCWWLAGIFGFRERATGRRWVRTVRVWIPRKNGKSILSVGASLYAANFEGEPGAEMVISAGSEEQAKIPYNVMRAMFEQTPDLRAILGVEDYKDFATFHATGGELKIAHSRAKNLDGMNPHVLFQEELHAQDQDVIGVLKTAQGSRAAPLDLGISTAGRDTNSAAHDDWRMCEQVLDGRLKASRMFICMYAGDDTDKARRFDQKVIEKLNPMFGVSLNPVSIEEEISEARKSESKLQEYLRTRLNIWSRGAGNLISVDAWDRCGDPMLKLEDLKGFPLYVGIDLASRSDLNAAAFNVQVGNRVYAVILYWIPEKSERLLDDRFADSFLAWHRDGHIEFTPGSFIDYRVILKKLFAMLKGHNVIGIGLDDYQANIMSSMIEEAGYRTFIVAKTARNLTASTEDLIARVTDPALFQHDANPVSAWCAGNVVGHYDANDNVLPKKEKKGSKANIDGMDAEIVANALRIDDEAGVLGEPDKSKDRPNPYLNRGLAGAEA